MGLNHHPIVKTYKVRVNMHASFDYDIMAKSQAEADERGIEKARNEYEQNGVDYPQFVIDGSELE